MPKEYDHPNFDSQEELMELEVEADIEKANEANEAHKIEPSYESKPIREDFNGSFTHSAPSFLTPNRN